MTGSASEKATADKIRFEQEPPLQPSMPPDSNEGMARAEGTAISSGSAEPHTKLVRITTVPISMNILLKDQLAYMGRHFEVVGVTSPDGKHFDEVRRREGVRMEAVAMSRSISPWKDWLALRALVRFMRREKPDIVHTHTPKAGLLGMAAAWWTDVPVRMHTVAGMPLLEMRGWKRRLMAAVERITYACAHRVYPNSFGLKSIIEDFGFCPPSKLSVLGNGSSNGIDTDYFDPAQVDPDEIRRLRMAWSLPEEVFVFGFVGRLAHDKGVAELVEAFTALSARPGLPPLRLLLVGPYEKEHGRLDSRTKTALESAPEIVCVGRHDDIRPFLALCDVFVFPSYREGFPNVVLQAGAMGLPCLVSDINGCNEIVTEGVNGLLYPPKDSQALFRAMERVLEQPDEREAMARQARPNIVARFQRHVMHQALEQEYHRRLLERKH